MQPEHIVKGYCPRLPGERLPASYINHYVANGGVVVPQFGGYSEELDSIAIKILQKAYGPDRKVVGVHSREVLLNAGNVHCITQQNPAPTSDAKPASKQSVDKPAPSGGGFFDSSVGSQFANRSESPKKAAPKQSAPTKPSSGGGGGFFDSSVGSQNGSRTRVLTKAARNQAAATEGSSGGFFDNSVGSEFANRSSAPKPAPKQAAPRKAPSGGGFFDKSIGSEFANRSATPKKAAPKQAPPRRASSGGGFFDSSVGSQLANRSESPKKAAPKQAAPTRASSSGKLLIVTPLYSKFGCCNILCKHQYIVKVACVGVVVSVHQDRLHKALHTSTLMPRDKMQTVLASKNVHIVGTRLNC